MFAPCREGPQTVVCKGTQIYFADELWLFYWHHGISIFLTDGRCHQSTIFFIRRGAEPGMKTSLVSRRRERSGADPLRMTQFTGTFAV